MAKRRVNKDGSTRKRTGTVTRLVPKPLTDRYLYVEVRAWFDPTYVTDGTRPVRQEEVFTGPCSFDSVIVNARNIDDAYQLGAAQLDMRKSADPGASHNHYTGQFLNDYVVKL